MQNIMHQQTTVHVTMGPW